MSLNTTATKQMLVVLAHDWVFHYTKTNGTTEVVIYLTHKSFIVITLFTAGHIQLVYYETNKSSAFGQHLNQTASFRGSHDNFNTLEEWNYLQDQFYYQTGRLVGVNMGHVWSGLYLKTLSLTLEQRHINMHKTENKRLMLACVNKFDCSTGCTKKNANYWK